MMTKLTLSLAGVVLACIGLHASSQSSLSVADDAAVQDLYGGACMAKTAITCNGADPRCVETDCFRLEGEGNRKNSLGVCCGTFDCGTVLTVSKCAVIVPDPN